MRKIWTFLYYFVLSKLPASYYPFGQLWNFIRVGGLRRICKIGEGCRVQQKVYVGDGDDVEIGDYCRINENVRLRNVKIGNYVMIAPGATVIGSEHGYMDANVPIMYQEDIWERIVIDDDVWIGTNAIITSGVTIGKGCVIGAGSVVTKNCVPYGVYGGIPARLIKKRDFKK